MMLYTTRGTPKEEQAQRKLKPEFTALAQCRKDKSMQEYSLEVVNEDETLLAKQTRNLRTLFESTLHREAKERQLDFEKIISRLGKNT